VVRVDAHALFDKGRLRGPETRPLKRLHGFARWGSVPFARDRGCGSSPSVGSPDKLPSLALEHDMRGTLEPTGSRNGSNARAFVVHDSGDLGHLFEPVEGQASNPDQ
jgi:hypothetical protein